MQDYTSEADRIEQAIARGLDDTQVAADVGCSLARVAAVREQMDEDAVDDEDGDRPGPPVLRPAACSSGRRGAIERDIAAGLDDRAIARSRRVSSAYVARVRSSCGVRSGGSKAAA